MNHISLIFSPENEPTRIDLFLSKELEGESRAAVQRYIETGCVLVDGKEVRTSLKLKGGEQIEIDIPPPLPAVPLAEAIPLDVLYEDSDLIVINKAAGMVVHPGAGNTSGTLVNLSLIHISEPTRPY